MGVKNLRHGEKRCARMEFRTTPTDKKFLEELARKQRRTVSSYVEEWIGILRKDENEG